MTDDKTAGSFEEDAFVDNSEALLREVEALRIGPNESLIIRIDPSVELEAAGFHEALSGVLVEAGLAGRFAVIAVPITKIEFAVVEHDPNVLGTLIKEA